MTGQESRTDHVTAPPDLRQMFRWWQAKAREDNPKSEVTAAAEGVANIPFDELDDMYSQTAMEARKAARARLRRHLIASGTPVGMVGGIGWEALTEDDLRLGFWAGLGGVGGAPGPLPADPGEGVGPVHGAGSGAVEVVDTGPSVAVGPVTVGGVGGVREVPVPGADEAVGPGHVGHLQDKGTDSHFQLSTGSSTGRES